MNEREQLNEQYLEAQLREELGIEPDLSEGILREFYAKHPPEKRSRVIPPPRRKSVWRPLAAAAAVLLAAGVATYSLVHYLPQTQPTQEHAKRQPQPVKPAKVEAAPPTPTQAQAQPKQQPADENTAPQAKNEPRGITPPDEGTWPKGVTDPPGAFPVPPAPLPEAPPKKPDDVVGPHPGGKGWTDPPGAFPEPVPPPSVPDKTVAKERPALVSAWKADGWRIIRDGNLLLVAADEPLTIRAGDRIKPKGTADLTLTDGGLLRLDGELSLDGKPDALKLTLHDGALYADVSNELSVASQQVTARVNGVSVLEQRLHGFDVFCISGSVISGDDELAAGNRARLEDDGFKHNKATTWADAQREFKFLRESPQRVMLREELDEAPGEIFGGDLKDGVLSGVTDSESGIGFYFREPYTIRDGDVVRFRFRVDKAVEMILQFGTVASDNWRYKMGGVKAGEWIEYELPLIDLYRTLDVAQKAQPGLQLKFFQLHPEEAKAKVEIDRVEIVHQP